MDPEQFEGPERLLLRTAAGDGPALLAIATILIDAGPQVPAQEALLAAECFASLAAATGSPVGRSVLAEVQLRRSRALAADSAERSDAYFWNAAALLFELAVEGEKASASKLLTELSNRADLGDEEAALMLNDAVATLPPTALDAAAEAGRRNDMPYSGLGRGEPGSLAEMLALASLAPGGGANLPLPANPTAGGQNGAAVRLSEGAPHPPGFTLAD